MRQLRLTDLDAKSSDYSGYYREKLEQGLQYQDYINDVLYAHGMVTQSYVSRRRGQNAENKLGIEIKRDSRFRETGNLYIETAEKSDPSRPFFVASGIHRPDNSWLYAIGDESTIWIFVKKFLRRLEEQYEKRQIATSKGYLLPVEDADWYCARRIDIQPKGER